MHRFKWTNSYVDSVPEGHSLNRARFFGATAAALAANAITLTDVRREEPQAGEANPSILSFHCVLGLLIAEANSFITGSIQVRSKPDRGRSPVLLSS
jgi:hypothetical protein